MDLTSKKIMIGAVHLPFFGSYNPRQSLAELEEYALANIGLFVENGIRSVYLQDENHCAGPAQPETLAVMAAIGRTIKREIPQVDLGIILQAHDGVAPLAVAYACGASFVRIKVFAGAMLKSDGILQGCGDAAVRYRNSLGADIKILADAHDRTGLPLADVPIQQVAGWASGIGADALILTGRDFDETIRFVSSCRERVKNKPLLIGGGVNFENLHKVLEIADGAVVSSVFKKEVRAQGDLIGWDKEKIRRFMDAVNAY